MLICGLVMVVLGGPGWPIFLALNSCGKASFYFDRVWQGAAGPWRDIRSVGLLVLTALSFAIAAMALGAAA